MAINYTWDVSTVDTYPTLDGNADVVYNVHWRLNAEDDADGRQRLAPSALIPMLVKAIQEQDALIEALTARVTTLEG